MLFPTLTPDMCANLAREEFGIPGGYKNKTTKELDKEICQSLIGTSYEVCSEIWNLLDPENDEDLKNAHPKHLFWGLVLLTTYCTEPVLKRIVGCNDAKTFRDWAWLFSSKIAMLKPRVIVFKNRFRSWDGTKICLISVDGVDCAIQEPHPFNTKIFSEKLNGPGYKYEVGVCIATGDIVWVNGPFEAGRHDVTIFQEDGLRDALCEDECIEVDAGYQGDDKFKNPNIAQCRNDRKEKGVVRARHENVNSRLKQFEAINGVFRHNVNRKERHGICFNAAAVITQLGFELMGGLYSVKYNAQYD